MITDLARLSPEERLRWHVRRDELVKALAFAVDEGMEQARLIAYRLISRGAAWTCEDADGKDIPRVFYRVWTDPPSEPMNPRYVKVDGFMVDVLWDHQRERLFAASCALTVLPLYEEVYPDDDRPRVAIETAVGFARGVLPRAALSDARDRAEACVLDSTKVSWALNHAYCADDRRATSRADRRATDAARDAASSALAATSMDPADGVGVAAQRASSAAIRGYTRAGLWIEVDGKMISFDAERMEAFDFHARDVIAPLLARWLLLPIVG